MYINVINMSYMVWLPYFTLFHQNSVLTKETVNLQMWLSLKVQTEMVMYGHYYQCNTHY